jgi:hypothetical protein
MLGLWMVEGLRAGILSDLAHFGSHVGPQLHTCQHQPADNIGISRGPPLIMSARPGPCRSR